MSELRRAVLAAIRRVGLSNTKRAAVLAVVVCALALSISVPLRTYLSQRAQIGEQLHQQRQLQSQVAKLQRRSQQLADPEQTRAEARKRLRYVMPGQTPYLVQLPDDTANQQAPKGRHAGQQRADQAPWYSNLWKSINQ